MQLTARHIIFTGRVQGVGFRFTAEKIARRHQLAGYVRNLPDGTVEMLAQGPSDSVQDCISDIEESFAGYIRKTDIRQVPPDPAQTNFRITF